MTDDRLEGWRGKDGVRSTAGYVSRYSRATLTNRDHDGGVLPSKTVSALIGRETYKGARFARR